MKTIELEDVNYPFPIAQVLQGVASFDLCKGQKLVKVKQIKTRNDRLVLFERIFRIQKRGLFWDLCAVQRSYDALFTRVLCTVCPQRAKLVRRTEVRFDYYHDQVEYTVIPYGEEKQPRIIGLLVLPTQSRAAQSPRDFFQGHQAWLPEP